MRSKAYLLAVIILASTLGLLAGCARKSEMTDAQLATAVQTKVYGDPAVQSRGIGVQAASGVVTLSGTVSSDNERATVAGDAATIAGVKTVVNNLQIEQAQGTPPPAPAAVPGNVPGLREKNEPARTTKRGHAGSNAGDNEVAMTSAPPVTQTPPPNTVAAPSQAQAAPAPPAPPPPPRKVTIPAGTQLTVRLNDPLDSEKNQVGDTWHGSLSAPVTLDGDTIVPSGADVVGRVVDVKSAGRFAGNSVLTIEVTSLMVNGKSYSVQTNQWSRSGKGEGKSTAVKVGGGAALGAIIGGLAGGGKGAAIGSVAGAGAGTGVSAAKKGQQIKLPTESTLNFQTINTLTVVPQSANDRDKGRASLSE